MDKKNNINLDQEDSQRIVYSKLSKDIQIQQNQFSSADNRVNGKYKNSKNKESFLKQNIKQRRTDILFRNLNDLFQRVKNLQNQGKQIQNQDIKNFVSDSCQIEKTIEEIEQYKTQNPEQFYSKNKFKLFPIYFYLTSKNFFIGILYFSSQSILECFCTYFLDMITENLKIYTGNYQQKRDLFLMLIAITIFYLAKNICYTRYLWYEAKWQVKSIAILQYLVFNKSLKIKNVSEGSNIEKKEANNSIQDEIPDINNIMTTDIEGLQQIYREVIGLIVNIITIILVLIMIYLKIGSHLFNGLYVLFFCLSLCIASVHFLIVFDEKVNSTKDSRVSLSKDIIEGIKNIKYLGWESIFKKKIEDIRKKEVKFTKLVKVMDIFQNTIFNILSYFMVFTLLISFTNDGNQLADSNIFTIIALYNVIYLPLIFLPWNISSLSQIYVQYKRVINFLNQPEVNPDLIMKLNQKDDTQDDKDLSILNEIKTQLDLSQLALQIKNAQFTWPEREKCQEQEIQVSQQIKISSENQKLIEMESQTKIDCKEQEKFKLKVSDLTIRKGELVIIIGKIGSGKSALLQGILNELEAKFNNTFIDKKDRNESNNYENKILINGNIGYVSQNHWLQNKSIKENILFGKEFDPIWYKQCVESCDLQVDFNQFSKKDEKLAGPGGSNLSGGQRQRVAICRAIYQSCDIYLFDDILSSLDAHVANHIYQSVIFDLLIKKYQKTVLLVTSHFSIFSDRQLINQVYYLQGGKLTNNSQEIEQFIQNTITQEQTDQNSKQHDLIIEQTEHKHQETSILNSNLNDSSKSNEGHENEFEEISEHKKYKQQESEDQQQENLSETSEKEEEEEDQEEREKGNIKLSTFKVYFKSVGIATLTLLLVFNFLAPASQMLIDFWLKDQISSSSNKLFEYLNEIFSTFALTFLFLIVVQTLISFVRGLLIYASYLNCSQKIFQQLNQTIIFSLMRFFDKNSIGSIVSRLSEDIYTVDQYLPWSLDLLLGQSAPALLYTLAILAQFPWLSIFILVQFFLISFVQKDFRLLNREVKRLNSVNQGRVLTVLDESSKGLVLIRSFNKQIHILGEYLSKLSEFVNTNLITEAIQIWLSLRLIFISNLIFICVSASTIVIIFGGYDFEYTNIAMCITYSMIFSSRISEVIRFLNYFEMNIVSVERIKKYFDNQQEDLDENSFKRQSDLDQSKILNKQQEEEGIAIEFENFYLTYDEIDQNTDQSNEQTQIKFALEDISLKIKKGEKIAFCGRTGSGKTSILNAIFRMYPIKYGRIYLNGQDIQFQSLRQIRSQMSIIPQFGFVYNASLIDNIDPERKIAREQIQQKVNETNLRITKNLNQVKSQNIKDKQAQEYLIQENQSLICEEIQNKQDLDENLDFEIQDGGQNLSNGEKQVVNFLRIIMRDTEIICLDEATSNMDPETDSQLHKQIFKFAQNKTLLVITHRLENIELFDRVVVLDNGKIVESGHVSQLKNIQGGFFNKLTKSK